VFGGDFKVKVAKNYAQHWQKKQYMFLSLGHSAILIMARALGLLFMVIRRENLCLNLNLFEVISRLYYWVWMATLLTLITAKHTTILTSARGNLEMQIIGDVLKGKNYIKNVICILLW
jgi:hypothetical protein